MINKAALTQLVRKSAGLSCHEAALSVDLILDAVANSISKGERIELRGLGTFFVRKVAVRKMSFNNPDVTVIPEHGRIVFRPSRKLRESVWNRVTT